MTFFAEFDNDFSILRVCFHIKLKTNKIQFKKLHIQVEQQKNKKIKKKNKKKIKNFI